MARPYRDGVELSTEPVPEERRGWYVPDDAVIVRGVISPAVPEPVPLVLLPGFEYRIRQWSDPARPDSPRWTFERRRVGGELEVYRPED